MAVEHEDLKKKKISCVWPEIGSLRIHPYIYVKKHWEDYDLALGFGVYFAQTIDKSAVQEFRKFKHTLFPPCSPTCYSCSGSMHLSIEPPEHTLTVTELFAIMENIRDAQRLLLRALLKRAHMGTNKWIQMVEVLMNNQTSMVRSWTNHNKSNFECKKSYQERMQDASLPPQLVSGGWDKQWNPSTAGKKLTDTFPGHLWSPQQHMCSSIKSFYWNLLDDMSKNRKGSTGSYGFPSY